MKSRYISINGNNISIGWEYRTPSNMAVCDIRIVYQSNYSARAPPKMQTKGNRLPVILAQLYHICTYIYICTCTIYLPQVHLLYVCCRVQNSNNTIDEHIYTYTIWRYAFIMCRYVQMFSITRIIYAQRFNVILYMIYRLHYKTALYYIFGTDKKVII